MREEYIDLSTIPELAPSRSLTQDIRDLLPRLGKQSFSANQICTVILQNPRYKDRDKYDLKQTIANILHYLAKHGEIIRTRKGNKGLKATTWRAV